MKVKMLTGLAGADYSRAPGDEHECSAEEAKRLIEAGFAEAIAPKAEKAVAKNKVETRG